MAKLGLEARMTIHELARRGVSGRQIARTLEVTEGTVRYHCRRRAAGAEDGRGKQAFLATGWHDQIAEWLAAYEAADEPVNLVVLHEWLVKEAGYSGSLRSLQRYVGARFPQPRVRARRRVETPPGAQADWAAFGGVQIADAPCDLYAFRLKLSHSRRAATVWSPRKDQLAWHRVHNEGFRRLRGVPAVERVDNEKTAVSRGATGTALSSSKRGAMRKTTRSPSGGSVRPRGRRSRMRGTPSRRGLRRCRCCPSRSISP